MAKIYGDLQTVGSQSIDESLTVTGQIGIGTSTINAPLQFSNVLANRKTVMWEDGNNDHQYYGFGVNGSILRYQTPASGADHVFYSGINSSSSLELGRMKGNGQFTLAANTNQIALGTTNTTTLTMASLTGSRTVTFPDANSNTVRPSSAGTNQFATGIASTGVISYAQPSFSNLSGTITNTQFNSALTSFSPVLGDGTNSFTGLTTTAYYLQMGNKLVTFWITFTWSGKGSASGIVRVTLPGLTRDGLVSSWPVVVGYVGGVNLAAAGLSSITGTAEAGSGTIFFSGLDASGNGNFLNVGNFNTTGQLQLSGTIALA